MVTAAKAIPIDKAQLTQFAKAIIKELPRRLNLKNMTSPIAEVIDYGYLKFRAGVFSGTAVDGKKIHIPVDVVWTVKTAGSYRKYVAGGAVTNRAARPGDRNQPMSIEIKMDATNSAEDVLSNLGAVEKEVFHVLIHEATHALDVIRAAKPSLKDKAPEVYHNKPSEVRAFLRQILQEAGEYLDREGQNDPGFTIGTNQSRPPTWLFDNILEDSKTWARIKDDLTEDNKKLIMRALVRHIQDEWSDIVKRYSPDPDDEPWENDPMPWLSKQAYRVAILSRLV